MKVGRSSNAAPDSQGTGAEGDIHPDDRRSEQAHLSMADSGTQKRGVSNRQADGQQRPGGAAGQPEGGRVPDAGGEDLQKIQAELQQQSAIRDLGKLALAFALANREKYVDWHVATYGFRPAGF